MLPLAGHLDLVLTLRSPGVRDFLVIPSEVHYFLPTLGWDIPGRLGECFLQVHLIMLGTVSVLSPKTGSLATLEAGVRP